MEIREYTGYRAEEILALYESVGWSNYCENPEMLKSAYAHSMRILGAYDGERLVGILRAVGDGHSAILIQDLLILPEYQRRGIGTELMKTFLSMYPDAYQIMLLTDNTEKTLAFYRSLGLTAAEEVGCRAFLKIN